MKKIFQIIACLFAFEGLCVGFMFAIYTFSALFMISALSGAQTGWSTAFSALVMIVGIVLVFTFVFSCINLLEFKKLSIYKVVPGVLIIIGSLIYVHVEIPALESFLGGDSIMLAAINAVLLIVLLSIWRKRNQLK